MKLAVTLDIPMSSHSSVPVIVSNLCTWDPLTLTNIKFEK
jgi:hypothetical protein